MGGNLKDLQAAQLAAVMATMGGMGLSSPTSVDFYDPPFEGFAVGPKGKHGGKPRHTDRDKAKAARKARKRNRK